MLLHDSQFDMYNMKCTLGIHGKKAPQENKRKTNQVSNTYITLQRHMHNIYITKKALYHIYRIFYYIKDHNSQQCGSGRKRPTYK